MSKIKTVSVVGAGQMGAGIAEVMAVNGYKTLLFDINQTSLEKGYKGIEKSLDRALSKDKITEEQKSGALKNLSAVSALQDLKDSDLVIEAIVEKFEIKSSLFKELDEICKKSCILASNTSSISITKLAAVTLRPEQVIGMHFMNPVPVMKLVEIICGLQTSDEAFEATKDVCLAINKTPVKAAKDYPGFIVNRILVPMINEAAFALMEGVGTVEEIDTAMELGTNQPMGPLKLADFVGLDTLLSICQIFQRELGDDKYRPCPLLVKYVEAGWLGKKSGKGFYEWDN